MPILELTTHTGFTLPNSLIATCSKANHQANSKLALFIDQLHLLQMPNLQNRNKIEKTMNISTFLLARVSDSLPTEEATLKVRDKAV